MTQMITDCCSDCWVPGPGGLAEAVLVPSHCCGAEDLWVACGGLAAARAALVLAPGWPGSWTTVWKCCGNDVVRLVGDLGPAGAVGCEPVRRFSWRTGQRHRPGLQYLVSTGRHHGFESLAEQRLLVALDFAGELTGLLAQPFRLRFQAAGGWQSHIPDFLAVTATGVLLADVRPGNRIGSDDLVRFAASMEVALACGWRYVVVAGWRPHVMGTLDTLSAQRRNLADPLGLRAELMARAARGPATFGELADATPVPAVARAHLLHLIWHRQAGIDLAVPLGDESVVWAAAGGWR